MFLRLHYCGVHNLSPKVPFFCFKIKPPGSNNIFLFPSKQILKINKTKLIKLCYVCQQIRIFEFFYCVVLLIFKICLEGNRKMVFLPGGLILKLKKGTFGDKLCTPQLCNRKNKVIYGIRVSLRLF